MLILFNMLMTLGSKYWKMALLFATIGFVALSMYQQHSTIMQQEAAIEKLTSENSILVNNQQVLTNSLERVNKSIDLLAVGVQTTATEFNALHARVSSQTKNLSVLTDKYKQITTPADCNSAIQLMIDARQDFVK